ncbi:MAG TPA: DnaJ C-terminal domain-containing protein [Rhodocyclaceae bacterium]
MDSSHDPFSLLGLPPTASLEEVKRAYRRLAMRWHPDRNPSAAAEAQFKQIKAAYELILDPQRYAEWLASATASSTAEAASGGEDQTETLTLSLEEAAQGCVKSIELVRSTRCTPCHGSGKIQRTHSVPCAICKGVGRVRGESRATRLCEACAGRGFVRETACEDCEGSGWRKKLRTLSVKVPPGILHGERLRLRRQAHHGPGAAAGDLYLEIRLAPHNLFELHERNLHCRVPVSIFRLLIGGKIEVPTLNGHAILELQPYPEHGLNYTLTGHGFPKKHGRGAGDLVLNLQAIYPQQLNPKDRDQLESLDAALADDLEQHAPELADWATRTHRR